MRPLEVDNQLKSIVGAGLYQSEEEVIRDAMNVYYRLILTISLK